jgi:FtsP/CotA-like multicopper oxidase with cupredoxin domain
MSWKKTRLRMPAPIWTATILVGSSIPPAYAFLISLYSCVQVLLTIDRMTVNGNTYLDQKVPSLFTAISAPQDLKLNPVIYGVNSNAFAVKSNDVVEIVINNYTPSGHPWHLHGHQFQVVARGAANSHGTYDPSTADPLPMKRDVAGVVAGGYVVFRFKADNPGVQLRKYLFTIHSQLPLSD